MSQPAKGELHHKYKCLKEYCEFVAYRLKMHVEKANVSLRHPMVFVNIMQEIRKRSPWFENVPA
jgi:hypothetical protein